MNQCKILPIDYLGDDGHLIVKPCEKTLALILYEYLNNRITLTPEYQAKYYKLKKGFEGEKRFCTLLDQNLTGDYLILNNLVYKVNGSKLQIDNALIYQANLHSFEVKNFEGDYYIEKEKWYSGNGSEIKDPIIQLKRSGSLFRRLLSDSKFNVPLSTDLVFVHPEFMLYQAPLNLPMVLPGQLNRFFKKLDQKIGASRLSPRDYQLSEKLLSLQIEEDAYDDLPPYRFDSSKKGATCEKCDSFEVSVSGNTLICSKCDHHEPVSSAVLRCVKEVSLLFPGRKITTNDIVEWCGVVSKKGIWRILKQNYELVYHGNASYFILDKQI